MENRDCYDKAVELLARRPHFERQLGEKLAVRGFSRQAIDACLERLRHDGLLDDRRTAREYIEIRLRRGSIGRRRMRLELVKRGAEEEVVDEALEVSFSDDDLASTREVAVAWMRRGKRDWAALARHLDRKGFSTGSILRVVDEARTAQPGDEDD